MCTCLRSLSDGKHVHVCSRRRQRFAGNMQHSRPEWVACLASAKNLLAGQNDPLPPTPDRDDLIHKYRNSKIACTLSEPFVWLTAHSAHGSLITSVELLWRMFAQSRPAERRAPRVQHTESSDAVWRCADYRLFCWIVVAVEGWSDGGVQNVLKPTAGSKTFARVPARYRSHARVPFFIVSTRTESTKCI